MQMLYFSDDAVLRVATEEGRREYQVSEDAMAANLRLVIKGGRKTFCYVAQGNQRLRISDPLSEFPDTTVETRAAIAARTPVETRLRRGRFRK